MPLGYVLTVDAVREHYAAESPAVRAMARAAQGRRIQVTDWPESLDARGETLLDGLPTPETLSQALRRHLDERMPGALPNDVPPRYPAPHGTVGQDIVLEIDAKTDQREAFRGGRVILDLLDQFNAPYRIKFSGNSSPHILIPSEAFEPLLPEEKREHARNRLFDWLMAQLGDKVGGWLDTSFKDPNHFLRLPYALNERTGLVSLPLRPEQYDSFEPHHAEASNVRVEEVWFEEEPLIRKRDGMIRLLREALGHDAV